MLPRTFVPLIFLPASLGLLAEVFVAPSADQKVLAIALLLFCPELARMAWVDLDNIAAVTNTSAELLALEQSQLDLQGRELSNFRRVVVSTIVLEATGFYVASVSLPGGAAIVILSQLWFNLLAKIQIVPAAPATVEPFGLSDRTTVLSANAVALALLCLWPILWTIPSAHLVLSSGLLALIVLFLIIKYGFS